MNILYLRSSPVVLSRLSYWSASINAGLVGVWQLTVVKRLKKLRLLVTFKQG
jgi:hypothetical protein